MDSSTHLRTTSNGSAEAQAGAIPLIDISRTPSPYPRARSAAQSEDEDEEYEPAASLVRPLVASDSGNGREGRTWQRITRNGGLGKFFFGTWVGWQIYVGLLVFWVAGTSFYLLLMNRFILLTGVYKFPYPLTMTWIQLVLEHIILLGFASFTRLLAKQFQILGLGAVVAPTTPLSAGSGYRTAKGHGLLAGLPRWITGGSGGIAGGGLFEFEWSTAKKVLPLAVVYMAKVVLSNISFAYAAQETYTLARIGVVPLSLTLASTSSRSSLSVNSVPTLSSALTAAFSLLVACIRSGVRVTWESILAGVFSSLFVAVYPIILRIPVCGQRGRAVGNTRRDTRILAHVALHIDLDAGHPVSDRAPFWGVVQHSPQLLLPRRTLLLVFDSLRWDWSVGCLYQHSVADQGDQPVDGQLHVRSKGRL